MILYGYNNDLDRRIVGAGLLTWIDRQQLKTTTWIVGAGGPGLGSATTTWIVGATTTWIVGATTTWIVGVTTGLGSLSTTQEKREIIEDVSVTRECLKGHLTIASWKLPWFASCNNRRSVMGLLEGFRSRLGVI